MQLVFSYIALTLLATVITSVVTANWFNNRNNYNRNYWRLVFMAFRVYILVKLVSFTLFMGWLIMILVVCMAFGGILLNVDRKGRLTLLATNNNSYVAVMASINRRK